VDAYNDFVLPPTLRLGVICFTGSCVFCRRHVCRTKEQHQKKVKRVETYLKPVYKKLVHMC